MQRTGEINLWWNKNPPKLNGLFLHTLCIDVCTFKVYPHSFHPVSLLLSSLLLLFGLVPTFLCLAFGLGET